MPVKNGCYVCKEKCRTDRIYCESCQSWAHYECEGIDSSARVQWTQMSLQYLCRQCMSTQDGRFDYLMASDRLRQAAEQGIKRLKISAEREQLLLEDVQFNLELYSEYATNAQDPVSNFILRQFHPSDKAALLTTGDGDCLFNAVSLSLCGDESRACEIKYRCCIEMVTNKNQIVNDRHYSRLELLSGDYDVDCLECARPNTYSPAWRIIALASLLNTTIDCVYPAVNGSRNYAFRNLNTQFRPAFVDPHRGRIHLMWTSTYLPKENIIVNGRMKAGHEWIPNHFVPLVQTNRKRPTRVQLEIPDEGPSIPCTRKHKLATTNRFQGLIDSLEEEVCNVEKTDHIETESDVQQVKKRAVSTPKKKKTEKKKMTQEKERKASDPTLTETMLQSPTVSPLSQPLDTAESASDENMEETEPTSPTISSVSQPSDTEDTTTEEYGLNESGAAPSKNPSPTLSAVGHRGNALGKLHHNYHGNRSK